MNRSISLRNVRCPWRTMSRVAAVILGVAAVLKLHAEYFNHAGFRSRWDSMLLINIELWLAAWLWSGWKSHWARWTVVACFLSFAAISFWKGWEGATSCGCFGKVAVNPWMTFALDTVILGLLLTSQDAPISRQSRWSLGTWTGIGGAISLTVVSFIMLAMEHSAMAAQQGFLYQEQSRTFILDPREWVGHEFTLARHTDKPLELMHGEWLAVLFHHDCSICESLLEELDQMDELPIPTALVELPPHSTDSPHDAHRILLTKLDEASEWFVETPSAVLIKNGLVTGVLTPVPEGSAKALLEFVRSESVEVQQRR